MKILHIYKDYYPVLGGIENHVKTLAEEQARRGHDVTVLVTSRGLRGEIGEMNGVRVIKAGRLATVASAPISLSLFGWLRRLPCDIAHLQFPYPVGDVAFQACGRARATLITYQSDIVRQKGLLRVYAPFLRRALQQADRILASNSRYVETSPYLSRVADKCTVIPLGIDLQRFARADEERVALLRRRYGSPLLIFVGRLRYYKGLEYLLQAMPKIAAHLLVVGTGPMERAWKELAAELAVADRVHFVGDVPDEALPAHYYASDIFVLPSSQRSEAFGVSMVEAMACGLPAVSTELGTGTSFVNMDGESGLVVAACNPEALATAINRLLADGELRRRLGEGARQRAWGHFSKEAMTERILQVYEEVLASKAVAGP